MKMGFLCPMLKLIVLFVCLANCQGPNAENLDTKYLLYDVNPPEGFNLRRDVYMRIAILVKHLVDLGEPWKLVLPPWGNMYHWQSTDIGEQVRLPWGIFFDIDSLQKFIPVVEMKEFIKEYGSTTLDEVYVLQHFTSAWEDGKWEEKMSVEECHEPFQYKETDKGFIGWFWGYEEVLASNVQCLSFQGHATSLLPLLVNVTTQNTRSVMVDRAEVALHYFFGDSSYWQVRRSMRFAKRLVKIANEFREEHFNSTDARDNTKRPKDWMSEKQLDIRQSRGGNYLSVHLRQHDFAWGRSKDVPSIAGAAAQIIKIAKQHNLHKVFVATDAQGHQISELKTKLEPLEVFLFEPSLSLRKKIKDGGVAIVEQIICSHAEVFYGTHESTYTYRIQEEREIMGFDPDSTFNRLCGDEVVSCDPPSRWRIQF